MDITELMIGDWARLKYTDPTKGEVVKDFQVTSVTTESPWNHRAVWSSEGNMGHEHIKGIPLTEKILEKNGIMFQFGQPWYQITSDGLQVVCSKPTKYVRVVVPYVHQLQQALRLCGLTELANNFKV